MFIVFINCEIIRNTIIITTEIINRVKKAIFKTALEFSKVKLPKVPPSKTIFEILLICKLLSFMIFKLASYIFQVLPNTGHKTFC